MMVCRSWGENILKLDMEEILTDDLREVNDRFLAFNPQ